MKKCTDKGVLRKSAEFEGRQHQKVATFTDFRRQFEKYQQAKTGRRVHSKLASRPYVEVFHQPQRGKKS